MTLKRVSSRSQSRKCSTTMPANTCAKRATYMVKRHLLLTLEINPSNINRSCMMSFQLLAKEQYDRWFAEEQMRLTRDRRQAQQGRPSSVAQKQMMKQGIAYSTDHESNGDTPWGISESETEPELASLDNRGAPGSRPIVRAPPRGLRLTEGTDAILQSNIVGNPKPRVSMKDIL
ncbi:hypothetical protein NECAME_01257 [Necator americanus]|uniref:Uncharacterized protein n=1 Tax=Necator americanus TaxID=51031 RepID=W2TZJ7_NECAM|nr:hypothetical protein NECAME_01257 [Necator americanus]ETN87099.1 hypothetical protein NECAME_01257 [Necator americanus]